MAFSESIKLEVKHKSHFRCCICHNLFVEVHHIIPQAEDGDDSFENAAPLCASCHSNHGGNPDFRKTIKQMRDFWYDRCTQIESQPDVIEISSKIDNMYSLLSTVNQNQQEQAGYVKNLAINVSGFFEDYAKRIRNATSFQEIADATSILTSGATGDMVPQNGNLPNNSIKRSLIQIVRQSNPPIISTLEIHAKLKSEFNTDQKVIAIQEIYEYLEEISNEGKIRKVTVDGATIESTGWRATK